MKKAIIGLISVLLVAVLGYGVYFNWATARTDTLTSHDEKRAGLAWVKSEFGLTDAQFIELEAANADYTPRCEAMCMQLAKARSALVSLVDKASSGPAEIEAAYAEVNRIESQCVSMTLRHVYQVSDLMLPEQGERYRKQMLSQLMGYRTGHHKLHADIVKTKPAPHAER